MTEPILFRSADLDVREFAADEVPRLQALFDANPDYFVLINGHAPDADTARRVFEDLPPADLAFGRHWCLGVFDRAGALAGVIVLVSDFCAPRVWHIALFFVATSLHGTGAAARLYDALESFMRQAGAIWLRLGVVVGNARGERFWLRLGYREVRRRSGVDTGGRLNDVRVLVKPIDPAEPVEAYLARVPRDRPGA